MNTREGAFNFGQFQGPAILLPVSAGQKAEWAADFSVPAGNQTLVIQPEANHY
jgi:hypothetical protein